VTSRAGSAVRTTARLNALLTMTACRARNPNRPTPAPAANAVIGPSQAGGATAGYSCCVLL